MLWNDIGELKTRKHGVTTIEWQNRHGRKREDDLGLHTSILTPSAAVVDEAFSFTGVEVLSSPAFEASDFLGGIVRMWVTIVSELGLPEDI